MTQEHSKQASLGITKPPAFMANYLGVGFSIVHNTLPDSPILPEDDDLLPLSESNDSGSEYEPQSSLEDDDLSDPFEEYNIFDTRNRPDRFSRSLPLRVRRVEGVVGQPDSDGTILTLYVDTANLINSSPTYLEFFLRFNDFISALPPRPWFDHHLPTSDSFFTTFFLLSPDGPSDLHTFDSATTSFRDLRFWQSAYADPHRSLLPNCRINLLNDMTDDRLGAVQHSDSHFYCQFHACLTPYCSMRERWLNTPHIPEPAPLEFSLPRKVFRHPSCAIPNRFSVLAVEEVKTTFDHQPEDFISRDGCKHSRSKVLLQQARLRDREARRSVRAVPISDPTPPLSVYKSRGKLEHSQKRWLGVRVLRQVVAEFGRRWDTSDKNQVEKLVLRYQLYLERTYQEKTPQQFLIHVRKWIQRPHRMPIILYAQSTRHGVFDYLVKILACQKVLLILTTSGYKTSNIRNQGLDSPYLTALGIGALAGIGLAASRAVPTLLSVTTRAVLRSASPDIYTSILKAIFSQFCDLWDTITRPLVKFVSLHPHLWNFLKGTIFFLLGAWILSRISSEKSFIETALRALTAFVGFSATVTVSVFVLFKWISACETWEGTSEPVMRNQGLFDFIEPEAKLGDFIAGLGGIFNSERAKTFVGWGLKLPKFVSFLAAIQFLIKHATQLFVWIKYTVTGEYTCTNGTEQVMVQVINELDSLEISKKSHQSWPSFFTLEPTAPSRVELITKLYKVAADKSRTFRDYVHISISSAFAKRDALISELHASLLTWKRTAVKRPITIWLSIFGDFGQGKSTQTYRIAEAFYKMVQRHYPDNLKYQNPFSAHAYFMMVQGEEYFDAYAQQPIILFEEVFQVKDVEKRMNQAMFFQNMVSPAPFPLLVADMTNKGMNYMTSDLCISTTNKPIGDALNFGIHDPNALLSRQTVCVRLVACAEPNCAGIACDEHRRYFLETPCRSAKLPNQVFFNGGEVEYLTDVQLVTLLFAHYQHAQERKEATTPIPLPLNPVSVIHKGPRFDVRSVVPMGLVNQCEDTVDHLEDCKCDTLSQENFFKTYPSYSSLVTLVIVEMNVSAHLNRSLYSSMVYRLRHVLHEFSHTSTPKDRKYCYELLRDVYWLELQRSTSLARSLDLVNDILSPEEALVFKSVLPKEESSPVPTVLERSATLWRDTCDWLETKFSRSWMPFNSYIANISFALATIGAGVILLYAVVQQWMPRTENQSGKFSHTGTRQPTSHMRMSKPVARQHAATTPAAVIVNHSDNSFEKKIVGNLARFRFATQRAFAFCIMENLYVTPKHVLADVIDSQGNPIPNKTIVIGDDGTCSTTEWDSSQLTVFTVDTCPSLIFFTLPHLRSRKNVVSLFAEMKEMFLPLSRVYPEYLEGDVLRTQIHHHTSTTWKWANYRTDDITMSDIMSYDMPCRGGICGVPYYVEPKGQPQILGIHLMGDEALDLSGLARISRCDVEAVVVLFKASKMGSDFSILDGPEMLANQSAPVVHTPGTQSFGKMPIRARMAEKSKLQMTEFHPDAPFFNPAYNFHFPAQRLPAQMKGAGQLAKVMGKYSAFVGKPMDLGPLSTIDYKELLPPDYTTNGLRRLTIEEAIIGIPGEIDAIDMSKSAGYPFSCLGKTRLQAIKGTNPSGLNADFVKSVEDLDSALNHGLAPMVVIDALKDELLPTEKVREGKVRLFLIGELKHYILYRQYLEPWWQRMQSKPYLTPISIGLNPHSSQWMALAWRLEEARSTDGSLRVMAGDFTGHEFSIPPSFVECFVRFVDTVYPIPVRPQMRRRNLIYSILWPYHLHIDRLYMADKGQSSGNALTALFASFASWLFHLFAWLKLSDDDSFYTQENWLKCVRFAGTGDDTVVTVKDAPKFNMLYLQDFAQLCGMKYTSCLKKEVETMYMALSEIDYLKRKFVWRDNWCYAPLNEVSVMEMLYWQSGSVRESQRRMDVANTLRMMLIEAVHYGPELYNRVLTIARLWLSDNNVKGECFAVFETAHQKLLTSGVGRIPTSFDF